jgi:hypothetical protein
MVLGPHKKKSEAKAETQRAATNSRARRQLENEAPA